MASVVSDSVRPHRQQFTRLPRSWDSPGKNTGVGCHFLLQCMKAKSESEVVQSCLTLSDPMDCSPPGSSVHGIFPVKNTGVGCHCLLLPGANRWLIGKDPDAGKDWGRRRGWQRMRRLDGITNSMDMNFCKLQEMVRNREAWHAAIHGVQNSWARLGDWKTTTNIITRSTDPISNSVRKNCVPTGNNAGKNMLNY